MLIKKNKKFVAMSKKKFASKSKSNEFFFFFIQVNGNSKNLFVDSNKNEIKIGKRQGVPLTNGLQVLFVKGGLFILSGNV